MDLQEIAYLRKRKEELRDERWFYEGVSEKSYPQKNVKLADIKLEMDMVEDRLRLL